MCACYTYVFVSLTLYRCVNTEFFLGFNLKYTFMLYVCMYVCL